MKTTYHSLTLSFLFDYNYLSYITANLHNYTLTHTFICAITHDHCLLSLNAFNYHKTASCFGIRISDYYQTECACFVKEGRLSCVLSRANINFQCIYSSCELLFIAHRKKHTHTIYTYQACHWILFIPSSVCLFFEDVEGIASSCWVPPVES